MGPSGKGGKKSVDAELNLIPFIDLLSVTILFLLMTAVWVEISKMSAFSQPGGETIVTHSDVSNINQKNEAREWDVLVTAQGMEIIDRGTSLGVVSVEQAAETIRQAKNRLDSVEEARISLRAADDVIYENVITVLDALYAEELRRVSIGGL